MKRSIEIAKELKKKIRRMAGETIYRRGFAYFNHNNVFDLAMKQEDYESSEIEITAGVVGSRDYEVEAIFDFKEPTFVESYCSCPCDFFCKHEVAVCLEFIEKYKKFQEEVETNKVKFINNEQEIFSFLSWEKNKDKSIVESIKGFNKNSNRKEEDKFLEKLKSIGLNPSQLPQKTIEELRKSMGETKEKVNSKKKKKVITKSKAKSKTKFSKKYKVVLEINSYNFNVKIDEQDSSDKYYRSYFDGGENIEELLNTKNLDINNAQRELLNFLKGIDFWKDVIGFEELFEKINLAQMKTVANIEYEEKKVQIINGGDDKIDTELVVIERNIDLDEMGTNFSEVDFFLRVDERYFKSINSTIIKGKDGILTTFGRTITFHKMPQYLAQMLGNVRRETVHSYADDNFEGEQFVQIKLKSSEKFKLNSIIRGLKKYTNLSTELEDDFEIKRFSKIQKSFLVKYSQGDETLSIYPAIDYGVCQIPITKTIFIGQGRQAGLYKRREYGQSGEKYVEEINLKNKTIFYTSVNIEKEAEFFRELVNDNRYEKFGFTKTGKCNIRGEKRIMEYYEKFWASVQALGYPIIFSQDEFKFSSGNFNAKFNVDLDADRDLLAFDIDCYCGDDKITLKTLRQYVNDKRGFLKTKNGKLLRVTNRVELEKFILMLESFYQQKNSNKFEGKIYHAPELEDIFTSSKYYNAKLDHGFKRFIKEAKSGKPVEKIKLPVTFKKIMRDYQREGMDWLYFLRKYRFAGILADDMGLGKTLQALTLMNINNVNKKPSLVICPKTLLYNWQMEAKKFMPEMKTLVVDGLPEERIIKIKKAWQNDLVITSYPMLQRDLEEYKKKKIRFNYCVLDEAQAIKNHRTKNAQTVKQVDADYRLALTGTPLENTVEEIWSIFDFLMPGFLGSYRVFSKKFLKPIMKEGDMNVLKTLRQKTACFMLRRTKGEVLKELPPKIENVKYCQLEDSQNILYQEILANVKSDIFKAVQQKGFAKSQIHILAGLTKLRQVCNHPNLLLKKKKYDKYNSAKLEAFNQLISEIVSAEQKVLVFSQFTTMLDILEAELKKAGVNPLYLSGRTKKRQQLIDKFNDSKDEQVFLISLKAGGVGLNLTAADNVIIFDPWWNPSVENQAIDRAHRIGQKKSVNVYRLITKGTIEERIVELQKKKQNLFDNLVGQSSDMFKKLTWKDIQNLFE